MRFVKWAGLSVFLIAFVVFVLENSVSGALRETVSFRFVGCSSPELRVFVWLILFFLAGVLLSMVLSFFREIRLRAENASLRHDLRLAGHKNEDSFEEIPDDEENDIE